MNLRYYLLAAYQEKIFIHPQKQMKKLGITYNDCEPQMIADQWWFFDCENIPEPLPKYLTEFILLD